MSNSDIEQSGTVKGRFPNVANLSGRISNRANLSGRISNVVSLSGHISIGSVVSDFIIKMTLAIGDDGNYTIASCDTTIEQIDAAVAAEKRVVVIASYGGIAFELPMIQHIQETNCIFSAFLSGLVIYSSVYKVENESEWNFVMSSISADNVSYSNDALPDVANVEDALNKLVPKSHAHSNKAVLDKFSETDGKPTYNGEALGSGAGDFIIKMTVEGHDEGYFTVTSCDTTIEQIDAAVAAEKRVAVIATDTASGGFWELPIVQAYQGQTYMFIAFTYSGYMIATVYKSGENEIWEFTNGGITSEAIHYYNSTQPDVESVYAALNKLFTNSHAHANKSVLDKFAETDGKPTYDGQALGGENTIYIPAKLIESDYDMPTIETSVTFEQIEAAYNLGRQQILKLVEEGSDKFIHMLPLVFASPGGAYYFETTINSRIIFAAVTPTNEWGLEFYDTTPTPKEEIVNDVLAALPTWTGGSY